jgi:DNA-directed RNA polymerase III subunit RPC1
VKGRIEITRLGEISKYIEEVFTPNGCYLNVKVDLDTINALYLELTIDEIKKAIIKHPAIKLEKNSVAVVGIDEIHVAPSKKGEVYF